MVFSAPPPSSSNSSDPAHAVEREYYEDASAVVPGSPVHADLQYLHRSLQKVYIHCVALGCLCYVP